jgi:hypothetical protein
LLVFFEKSNNFALIFRFLIHNLAGRSECELLTCFYENIEREAIMRYRILFSLFSVLFIWGYSFNLVGAGFGDILKGAQKALGTSDSISESEIIKGLKEALEIGSAKAVDLVSKPDGYYKNADIKIPLPESVQKVEKLLRGAGFGQKVDAFELSMNRAAEQAAPEAKSIFWDAIKKMDIAEARKILNGRDDEATLYFKDKTYQRLEQSFKPIVENSMGQVGVTRAYQDLNEKVETIPFAGGLSFDLDQYVTEGALDGLFKMLAEEEKKIRSDPSARVTDLLRKVFGDK